MTGLTVEICAWSDIINDLIFACSLFRDFLYHKLS